MKILSRKCSFEGCHRAHHAGGLCHSHDAQRRRGGELRPIRFARDIPCAADDCGRPSQTKGFCQSHYQRDRARAKREATAHPCRACDTGIAYLKSALCDECKVSERKAAMLRRPEAINAAHRSNKPRCEVGWCERPVAANTVQEGTLASRLCTRHASDASSKTMKVDAYLALMSRGACEACGGTERLVVDHRHGHHDHHAKMCAECIRGRLCSACNTSLGLMGDSPERIEGLLAYIRRFLDG